MTKLFAVLLACIMTITIWFYYTNDTLEAVDKEGYSVLVAYNQIHRKDNGHILKGYASVLEEEGIPFDLVSSSALMASDPKMVARNHPAIIFPDGVARRLSEDLELWTRSYLKHGGNIAVIFDAGSYSYAMAYKAVPLFTSLTGINYLLSMERKEKSFATASIRFKDKESAELFQIPPGKLNKKLDICGYGYESLEYQVNLNRLAKETEPDRIYANAVLKDGLEIPALTIRKHGKGKVMYVNLPLGGLKTFGTDDLMPRAILRTFLFDEVGIIHLANTPKAKAGFIFNWHIDNNTEWVNIPHFAEINYLRESMPASFHITAGDFAAYPSDGIGFQACDTKEGRLTVKIAEKYGEIGSHGGWRHDWFAFAIRDGKLNPQQIEHYIKMNNDCLEKVTGKKVVEYSAPVGVHPQPLVTQILVKHGVFAYYFTGDSGSGPNRSFAKGKMVSKKAIAFPIMPFRTLASFHEMHEKHITAEELTDWLIGTVDYSVRNGTVRMVYSHLYDLANYPEYHQSFEALLAHLEKLQEENKLIIAPMRYFAEYLLKFLKTKHSYFKTKDGMRIAIYNPEKLADISVAVPKKRFRIKNGAGLKIIKEDKDYFYVSQENDVKDMAFDLLAR